jgi:hypothetical protein
VALCVLGYFGIIKALQAWVRQRGKPFDLNWVRLPARQRQAATATPAYLPARKAVLKASAGQCALISPSMLLPFVRFCVFLSS